MDKFELEEFRKLVDAVIYSSTKNEAKDLARRLDFMATQIKSHLDGYLSGIINKIVSHAKEASGQVRNKEDWISNVEQNGYILVNFFDLCGWG